MKAGVDSGQLTVGRYTLIERIAAGGMGEVYIGLMTGIGRFERPIAVKLLLPHLGSDPKIVSMFLTEARIGAQLSHANIAQVYDVGLERDRYFIAMELVRGVSLTKLVAGLKGAREQLPPELLAYIGRCLCEGLHVAHEQRGPDGVSLELVHRDVTPHNVLISVDGAVKLTDFGIARVADADRLSRPGVVMGKLGYLAPEQLTGQPIDRRVDVFAAGATMFTLSALEKPFETATGTALDPSRLPTVPLRVLRPDLPRQLVNAVERAMEPDLARRFATAKDFRNALPVPGPDCAEELGKVLRRVCSAALIELETKTERATQAIHRDAQPTVNERPLGERRPPRPVAERGPEPARPQTASDRSAVHARRDRRPLLALLLLVAAGAGAAAWLTAGGQRVPEAGPVAEPRPEPPPPDPKPVDPAPAPKPEPEPLGPPPPRPVEPAADRTPGTLSIDATPWATITVDGRPLGETPLANVKLPPGAHTVVAANPDTGKTVKQKITIAPGKLLAVRLDLR